MLREYFFFGYFLLCFIAGAENKDLINGLNVKNSKYSFVKPQVVHRWARDSNRQSQLKESEEETISYAINIGQRKHFLHLQKNRGFLHPNVDIWGHNKSARPKKHHEHCYYHGEVEGYENSVVALSTCSGLRGVIIFGNETYGLEPVPDSVANEHLLYELRDVNPENVTCGVVSEATAEQSRQSFEPGQSLVSLLRRKRNLPQTSYVELALVADNLRYKYKGENETAVREEMVEMANLLDGYYKPLNIRVVLVGLEVFKDGNPFSVDGSAREVLSEFVKWRKSNLLPKVRHDVGQLIVGRPQPYDGNVLGMAFVGTVCSASSSGGINVFGNDNLVSTSTVVAHEMGHNLGMSHDTTSCSCETKNCIMAPSASGSTSFSSCSAEDFEALVLRGGGVCLKNQPSHLDVVSTAKCGNGLLEEGEECDCGTPEECKTKCCDAATCKLTSGSSCAEGSCCDNCQIKVAGTLCRGSVNSCDLPEYCNGQTEFCPEDFYIMDGLPCENDAAYCYEGRCQTYDYQCKYLFMPDPAKKAADECFLYANVQGNKFGNCGITSRGDYIKCSVADAMCGKVQCSNVNVNQPPPGAHVSIQVVNGSKCVNADFDLGTDVLDPAYVNPGSPCAKGKTCLDFKCVDASALKSNLDCDAQTTCNGHGICNDQGHCHCQNGWAPPKCDRSGPGGSVDSGPAQIDYSLRNGLLIFFLLVVPLIVLALVLLYVFRRDTLDSCLKGGRRRRSRNTQHGNNQSNSDVNAHTTTQLPAHVPHEVEYPPATSVPISGFRYGELDYWNTESKTAPAKPPPPTQGPGVPRPIPPRQLPA